LVSLIEKIRWWNVACKVRAVLRHSGQSGLHSKRTGKPGRILNLKTYGILFSFYG
jgi:hypothetical protein